MARAKKMKKAELLIGNKAYTLIEVLCAIIVISTGVLFIFPGLFKASQTIAYLPNRFQADIVLNNLFVNVEEGFCKTGFLTNSNQTGEKEMNGQKFVYETSAQPLDTIGTIYQMKAEVTWKDFKKNAISRTGIIAR